MLDRCASDGIRIDWSQNSQSKTTVCVYAMRAKRDEPYISMPLTWREISRAKTAKDRDALYFTPAEALRRVKKISIAQIFEGARRL